MGSKDRYQRLRKAYTGPPPEKHAWMNDVEEQMYHRSDFFVCPWRVSMGGATNTGISLGYWPKNQLDAAKEVCDLLTDASNASRVVGAVYRIHNMLTGEEVYSRS